MWSIKARAYWRATIALAVLALVVLGGPAAAQTGGQEQIVKDGKKYMYQGKQIKTPAELKPIVANHPEAAAAASKSSTYRGFALVLGAVGGGLIGWPIGQAIGGAEDPNWALAAAGAGALAVAIWTGVSSDKQFKKAVDLYNGPAPSTSMVGVRLQLAAGPGRVGLRARF